MAQRARGGKAAFFPGKRPPYSPYARPPPAAPAKAKHEDPLTDEQERAVRFMNEGTSFFLTGPAGCGKTHTLKRLHALSPHDTTRVTALTGLAARNLECGATTLHSFAGIRGIVPRPAEEIAASILKDPDYKWVKMRIQRTRRLFIDEISMASAQFLEKVERICQIVRASELPFGGIQVIMCGDFHQLAPVRKTGDPPADWAFQSKRWPVWIPKFVILSRIFRQSDAKLIHLLHHVADGCLTDADIDELKKLNRPLTLPPNVEPIALFAHNDEADAYNVQRLAEIDGDVIVYPVVDHVVKGDSKETDEANEAAYKKFVKDSLTKDLHAKVGAAVMLINNDYMQKHGLGNGSRGKIVALHRDTVDVRFPGVPREVRIETRLWEEPGKWSRTALPLVLAWAITIHKSQGLTIPYLIVDPTNVFADGQAYVALSRAESLETLQITPELDPALVTVNPHVERFYSQLRQRHALEESGAAAGTAVEEEFPMDDADWDDSVLDL